MSTNATQVKMAKSIKEFCASWSISPAHYFRMQAEGRGPAVIRLGRKVVITAEAEHDWAERMAGKSATAA